MIRPTAILVSTLLLSGCGTYDAHTFRNFVVGRTEPDVLACLGVPDQKTPTGTPGESVLQWNYTQAGTDVDLEAGIYSAKLGRPGICHTVVRFQNGIALGGKFPDADITATNPDSICGRQVKECLDHIDHTALPPGYSDDQLLTGNRSPVK